MKETTQTIIVTGGAGYIGSHTIIELLTTTDFNVVSIDNFSNSTPASYDRIKKIANRSFESLNFDLCNEAELNGQLSNIKNIAGIIHFAAYKSVPESMTNPLLYYHNNLTSLNNLLKFALKQNIKNFIFSSSCSVYGNADKLPVTEETELKKAESPYGHTKQIGEDIIRFVCRSELNTVILRYFNPVGAHTSGQIGEFPLNRPNNLVPIITQAAVGKNSLTVFGDKFDTRDGSCIRDYIHVSDIANAHVKALNYLIDKKNKSNTPVFNLGTGDGVSVLEAIKSFEKVSGKKLNYTIGPPREGDVVAVYADNTLARNELSWQPKFGLDDMMASAWKWQQTLEAGN
ncbi:MAG: UDP-glucose 4-epimerase GalE [Bacteroidetes bacterium]|nr:UDP-glucose 4-epimerase GalE [Bacteroidota bacterium]